MAAFKKFKNLPDGKYDELVKLFEDGKPATEVARIIHEDWQLLLELTPQSLVRTLQRFNEVVIRGELIRRVVDLATPLPNKELREKLDALDELEELARVQKGRLYKIMTQENKGPMVMKAVSDEVKILTDLLNRVAMIHLETGVLKRASKKFSGSLTDENGGTREFSVTEEVDALMAGLTQALKDVKNVTGSQP